MVIGSLPGARSPCAVGVTAGPARTSLPSRLRPRPPPPAIPAREPRRGGRRAPGSQSSGRRPLGAAPATARAREGKLREGPGPGRAEPSPAGRAGRAGPAASATRENGGSPGPVTGRGRRKPGGRPRREQGRAGGHSRGWAGRLPLRLRVVAVPVLGRRRLGLLARSPRGGTGARPLRCLPPAPAPGDGLPRQRRRRLSGRTAAQGLPRRPPHCCARSLGLRLRLLLRGPAPPSPSPFSRLLEAQSLPGRAAPSSRPEPGFDVRTAQPPRARRRAVPQRPLQPRAPPGGRADSSHRSRSRGRSRGGRREKTAAAEDARSFPCHFKCWCSALLCRSRLSSRRNPTSAFYDHFLNSSQSLVSAKSFIFVIRYSRWWPVNETVPAPETTNKQRNQHIYVIGCFQCYGEAKEGRERKMLLQHSCKEKLLEERACCGLRVMERQREQQG
ncbi:basic proline-rich protein [Neofelis nebulosa]|uniref:basic proline-rich protein n=1 Tax=Neofelis nebulosa TaxID=61452 RepID=UPI00272BDD1A|nr:basic proline-rich protein [Neofelis nebulosa]